MRNVGFVKAFRARWLTERAPHPFLNHQDSFDSVSFRLSKHGSLKSHEELELPQELTEDWATMEVCVDCKKFISDIITSSKHSMSLATKRARLKRKTQSFYLSSPKTGEEYHPSEQTIKEIWRCGPGCFRPADANTGHCLTPHVYLSLTEPFRAWNESEGGLCSTDRWVYLNHPVYNPLISSHGVWEKRQELMFRAVSLSLGTRTDLSSKSWAGISNWKHKIKRTDVFKLTICNWEWPWRK